MTLTPTPPEDSTHVTLRLPTALVTKIQTDADRERRSRSAQILVLIEQALRETDPDRQA